MFTTKIPAVGKKLTLKDCNLSQNVLQKIDMEMTDLQASRIGVRGVRTYS